MATGSIDTGNDIASLDQANFTTSSANSDTTSLELESDDSMPWMPQGMVADQVAQSHIEFRFLGSADGDKDIQPLSPAIATSLESDVLDAYPFAVIPPENIGDPARIVPIAVLFEETIDELAGQGTQLRILAQHRLSLAKIAALRLERIDGVEPLDTHLTQTLIVFRNMADLSQAGLTELNQEIELIQDAFPHRGIAVGFGAHVPLLLMVTIASWDRQALKSQYSNELRDLIRSLDARLEMDRNLAPEAKQAPDIERKMGGLASVMVDADALSSLLGHPQGSLPLEEAQKKRMVQARDTILEYLDSDGPNVVVIHRTPLHPAIKTNSTGTIAADKVMSAAQEEFERQMEKLMTLCKAVRIARLDLLDEFEPNHHGPALNQLAWTDVSPVEMSILPHIVAWEEAPHVQDENVGGFTSLLNAQYPVTILLHESALTNLASSIQNSKTRATDLARLAMSQKNVHVVRSTACRPQHLFQGIASASHKQIPNVIAVDCPQDDTQWITSFVAMECALRSRVLPSFTFDPSAGNTWADRFSVEGNPDETSPWPQVDFGCRLADGQIDSCKGTITPAHFAAMCPELREHFLVIPPADWSTKQQEVSQVLASDALEDRECLPFIWNVNIDGVLEKALVTQSLLNACLEYRQVWHTLQELAGIQNSHAIRAEEIARTKAWQEAEARIAQLESEFKEEVERVRSEAGRETMERLASVLLDLDTGAILGQARVTPAVPSAVSPVSESAVEPVPEVAEPTVEPAPKDEEDELAEEPYIDSELCTTCNECININPQLFAYNPNKQATIADAQAGTFAQLVAAAEKCPARCIHPGNPRADDDTASDELVAKAAKYN